MKILLLNDGGYHNLDGINFPVEVEARRWDCEIALVSAQEMQKVGADGALGGYYPFYFKEECTIISE